MDQKTNINKQMKPTILLVEDEQEIADTLTYALSTEGFEPIWVTSGQAAFEALSSKPCALAVLDVGLPDSNGFELLKAIRTSGERYANLPCLFLTARNDEIDRIIGLEIGADDYVCKPFSPREVVARIKVILKRSQYEVQHNGNHHSNHEVLTNSANTAHIDAGTQALNMPFSHNVAKRQIMFGNTAIDCTKAEYKLMIAFIEQVGKVYSRRELIDRIWSDKHPSDDRAIDTHIKTLRAKLKTHAPEKDYIMTHRGHGYSLELDD